MAELKKKILFQTVFGMIENVCAIAFMVVLANLTDFILQGDARHFGQYVLMATALLAVETMALYLEKRSAYRCEAAYGRRLRDQVYRGLLCRRNEDIVCSIRTIPQSENCKTISRP